ncbi:hypothetical protein LTR85_001777 [Meristemomyces frigidus]|nr:hypothetical protein LTR85_001777 [Meristemomyces frigidus]
MADQTQSRHRQSRLGPAHIRGGVDLTKLDTSPSSPTSYQRLPEPQGGLLAGQHWPAAAPATTGHQQYPFAPSAQNGLDSQMHDAAVSGTVLPRPLSQLLQSLDNPTSNNAQLKNSHGVYGRPVTPTLYDHPTYDASSGQIHNQAQVPISGPSHYPTMRLSHTQQPPTPTPTKPPGFFRDNLYHEGVLATTAAMRKAQWDKQQAAAASRQGLWRYPEERRDSHDAQAENAPRPALTDTAGSPHGAVTQCGQQAVQQHITEQHYREVQQQQSGRKGDSSDTSATRAPSLAATRPAQYKAPTASSAMTAVQKRASVAMSTAPDISSGPAPTASVPVPQPRLTSGTSSTQPAKLPTPPWAQVLDPMLQTSSRVRKAEVHLQGMAPEAFLSGDLVLSPVQMIGLPFGGVIEQAHRYPDKRVERQREAEASARGQRKVGAGGV